MTVYADGLLPHDIEAEEAVIGSLLIDGECITRVAPILQGSDFYRERNQLCFDAAMSLFQRGQAIDHTMLAGELARTEKLDAAGGMAYLSHVVAVTPTSVHVEDYAQAVIRTSTMRRIIQAASQISALVYSDTNDVESTLRKVEDALFAVRGASQARGYIPLRQIYDQYLEDQATADDPLLGAGGPVMSGYADLDELLGGFRRSYMVILGARPSMGKSALALNVAANAVKAGLSTGFVSLEMTAEDLGIRLLSSESGVPFWRLNLGLSTAREDAETIDAIGRLSDWPLFIDETPYQSLVDIRSKARRLSLEHGLDLLVIDYLQLIEPPPGHRRGNVNRVQEITEISRGLKMLARELDVPVLACAQLNRQVESRPGHRPQISDLRESGSIEQDADVVMFIHREEVYLSAEEWSRERPGQPYPQGVAEIIVAKHRNGSLGSIPMAWRDALMRFESIRG